VGERGLENCLRLARMEESGEFRCSGGTELGTGESGVAGDSCAEPSVKPTTRCKAARRGPGARAPPLGNRGDWTVPSLRNEGGEPRKAWKASFIDSVSAAMDWCELSRKSGPAASLAGSRPMLGRAQSGGGGARGVVESEELGPSSAGVPKVSLNADRPFVRRRVVNSVKSIDLGRAAVRLAVCWRLRLKLVTRVVADGDRAGARIRSVSCDIASAG